MLLSFCPDLLLLCLSLLFALVCFIYLDCLLLKICKLLWKSATQKVVCLPFGHFYCFYGISLSSIFPYYWICGKVKWYDAQAIVNTFFGQMMMIDDDDDDDRNFCILISSMAYGVADKNKFRYGNQISLRDIKNNVIY